MKRKENKENVPPLAHWKNIVQPASLTTKTGKRRFLITIKLPERSLKTASDFVAELNASLESNDVKELEAVAHFVLVDTERSRLQRATAEFCTFKDAQTCLSVLKEMGLLANDVSGELEDFGNKQYDPWHEKISRSRWPWLAAWRNPAPELPMVKAKNRLDMSAGTKYTERADGKLGKSDEEDRSATNAEDQDRDRSEPKPREDEDRDEKRKRRKKKKADEDGGRSD